MFHIFVRAALFCTEASRKCCVPLFRPEGPRVIRALNLQVQTQQKESVRQNAVGDKVHAK